MFKPINVFVNEIVVGGIIVKSPYEACRGMLHPAEIKIYQRGVQWKQGVVVYIIS